MAKLNLLSKAPWRAPVRLIVNFISLRRAFAVRDGVLRQVTERTVRQAFDDAYKEDVLAWNRPGFENGISNS